MSTLVKLLFLLLCLIPTLAFGQNIGVMINEADGSPTGYAYKLVVPNDSLSLTSSVGTLSFLASPSGGLVFGDSTPDSNGEVGFSSNAFRWFANSEDLSLTASANLWTFDSTTSAAFAFGQDLAVGTGINFDASAFLGRFGIDDTEYGRVVLHGSTDHGGAIAIYVEADSDAVIDYFWIMGADDTLTIGPNTDTAALKIDASANVTVKNTLTVGSGTGTPYMTTGVVSIGTQTKSFIINEPTASDDFLIWRTPTAITITAIHGVLLTGTNVIGGVDECDSNGANCVAVDADITFNGSLDSDDGSLTNGAIDAGDWIRWHTTSVDAPGYLTVTIYFQ
jgi:hypothetical protein